MSTSDDGRSLASCGADTGGILSSGESVKGSAKVFDVENFGELLRVLHEVGKYKARTDPDGTQR